MSDARSTGRIGVIVPSSNVNLEPDVSLLLPEGVTAHFARVGDYDPDVVPDSEEMRAFGAEDAESAARMLAAADVGVVVYGCTSGTLAHGPDFDRELAARLAEVAGVPAVTAAGGLVEALTSLGVTRIGLASPYVEELHAEAQTFLEACGFRVVASAFPPKPLTSRGQRALRPADAHALGLRADTPEAEALVVSCTDLRAVETIAALEHDLGKPVITSNQALVHASLVRIGLAAPLAAVA
jgi:maleate isomerase